MNKTERERITAHIREDHPYIVALRRHFHRHPKIAKEEFHTAELIEAELDKIGLVHRRVGETGVYAEIQGKNPGRRWYSMPISMPCLFKRRIPANICQVFRDECMPAGTMLIRRLLLVRHGFLLRAGRLRGSNARSE